MNLDPEVKYPEVENPLIDKNLMDCLTFAYTIGSLYANCNINYAMI